MNKTKQKWYRQRCGMGVRAHIIGFGIPVILTLFLAWLCGEL